MFIAISLWPTRENKKALSAIHNCLFYFDSISINNMNNMPSPVHWFNDQFGSAGAFHAPPHRHLLSKEALKMQAAGLVHINKWRETFCKPKWLLISHWRPNQPQIPCKYCNRQSFQLYTVPGENPFLSQLLWRLKLGSEGIRCMSSSDLLLKRSWNVDPVSPGCVTPLFPHRPWQVFLFISTTFTIDCRPTLLF